MLTKGIGFNAAIVTGGRVLGIASAFLFNALLARIISQDQMGYYFLVLNLITFFAIPARAGCENVAMKMVSDFINAGRASRLSSPCRNFGGVFFVSSSLTLLVCWFGFQGLFEYVFKAKTLIELIPLLCFWIFLFAAQLVLSQILRAFKKFFSCSLLCGPVSSAMNFIGLLVAVVFLDEVGIYHVVSLVV
ncbi:MAG: hypothetical protein V7722_00800, partial [Porticoccus sp.]